MLIWRYSAQECSATLINFKEAFKEPEAYLEFY